jgi:hypothetical protein
MLFINRTPYSSYRASYQNISDQLTYCREAHTTWHFNRFLVYPSQCCGSGSGLDRDPGRQKWHTKIENVNKINFLCAGCTLLRTPCNLYVLQGVLGIRKLQFLIKKRCLNKFSAVFFSIFCHQNPGSGSGSVSWSGFTWNTGSDPVDPYSMNPDPQHWSITQYPDPDRQYNNLKKKTYWLAYRSRCFRFFSCPKFSGNSSWTV